MYNATSLSHAPVFEMERTKCRFILLSSRVEIDFLNFDDAANLIAHK